MTSAQKIALRISQVRQRLNEIAGLEGDTLTDEVRAEATSLQGEYSDLETRHQAAIVGEGDPAVKETEKREGGLGALIEKAKVSEIVQGIVEHRALDGATKELQDELGLDANQIPLALLEPRAQSASSVEHRTSGVTPAPSDVGQEQRPIIGAVFPQSAAAFLGIMEERLPVGEAVYTVLSSSTAETEGD